MLVHVIADYGVNDLAFSEVFQKIKLHLPDAEISLLSVPPFATLAAGFCITQLALNPCPPGTLIYHNIAPRQDQSDERANNAGERLAYARLPTGCQVIGVNAGFTFSFLSEHAETLRWLNVTDRGSQFRSRDVFPEALHRLCFDSEKILGEKIPPRRFPKIPENRIAYVDGYGNIKTTLQELPRKQKRHVRIRIGKREHEAVCSGGSFEVKPGELALAPGSSGWTVDGKQTTFYELFLRGGNAWELFGRPAWESEFAIVF